MTDTASASLPDVEGLQAPPQAPPGELPDVDSLSDAPAAQPGFGGAVVQPGFRGARGGIPNIPDAAAARFRESDSVANIFKAAGTRAAGNFVSTFNDLTSQDQQMLVANGYGNYTGAGGGIVQHAADAINSGYYLITDGFMAAGAGFSGLVAGAEGQLVRERGGTEAEAQRAEREGEFIGMAIPADVGAMHGLSMLDAAKAQMTAPGIWANGYRIDQTEAGALVRTPLGKFPDAGAEAVAQSKTAADALHLGPDTATLIHQTYLDTGRPPAETLMDAKTNAGGVLDDLVAGKVPTIYRGTAGPEEATGTTFWTPDKQQAAAYGERAIFGQHDVELPEDVGSLDEMHRDTIRDIAKDEGIDISKPVIQQRPADLKNPLDLRDMGTDVGDVEETWDKFHEMGFINEPWASLDDDVKDEVHQDYDGKALWYFIENEHIAEGAEKAGHDGIIFGDLGTDAKPHDTYAVFPKKPGASPEGGAVPPQNANEISAAPAQSPPPSAPTPEPEQGVSKIGQSIEAKAVEAKLTQGFAGTAGYDKITIADQAAKATDLVNNSLDDARAVIRGDAPLPSGLKGTALITAMEDYIKKNPNADMAYELANSPLVSHTSEAAQEMRLAAEREPDSAAAKIQELRDAQQKVAGGPKQIAARRAAVKQALPEARGVLLPKESLSWDNFLESIRC